jgi:hypothetical protein
MANSKPANSCRRAANVANDGPCNNTKTSRESTISARRCSRSWVRGPSWVRSVWTGRSRASARSTAPAPPTWPCATSTPAHSRSARAGDGGFCRRQRRSRQLGYRPPRCRHDPSVISDNACARVTKAVLAHKAEKHWRFSRAGHTVTVSLSESYALNVLRSRSIDLAMSALRPLGYRGHRQSFDHFVGASK